MRSSAFITFFHDALNAYNKMCEPILHEFNIPQVSFDILMFLNNNPDLCTAQQISEFRNIKKNLVSVHVDKLVTAGYLQTRIRDRRQTKGFTLLHRKGAANSESRTGNAAEFQSEAYPEYPSRTDKYL